MALESAIREKLTRIWSQRRGRYVLLRLRYETQRSAGESQIVQLYAPEELDGY